jgi:hypothetical protein
MYYFIIIIQYYLSPLLFNSPLPSPACVETLAVFDSIASLRYREGVGPPGLKEKEKKEKNKKEKKESKKTCMQKEKKYIAEEKEKKILYISKNEGF